MKERIIVIDTETTGVEPQDRVIETCAVEVGLSGQGKHTVLLDTLVQPTIPIGAAAMGTHHITEEFAEVEEASDAMKQEGKTVFAAHNAAFDRAHNGRGERGWWEQDGGCTRREWPPRWPMSCSWNGVGASAAGIATVGATAMATGQVVRLIAH